MQSETGDCDTNTWRPEGALFLQRCHKRLEGTVQDVKEPISHTKRVSALTLDRYYWECMRRSGVGSTHPLPLLIHNTHTSVERANRRRRLRLYKRCAHIPQLTTNFNKRRPSHLQTKATQVQEPSQFDSSNSKPRVLAVMTAKITVFLDLTPCSLVTQISVFRTERINVVVTLYTRIRKAVGSNIEPNTCYRDWEFS